jgi:hypothetical protein
MCFYHGGRVKTLPNDAVSQVICYAVKHSQKLIFRLASAVFDKTCTDVVVFHVFRTPTMIHFVLVLQQQPRKSNR